MDHGISPRADFFEDTSSDDGSEWEDDNGTRNFSEVEGLGIRGSVSMADDDEEESRGRKRHIDALGALPPFNQLPAHDSGTATANEVSSLPERESAQSARQMPLRRFGNVQVVHNRGSGSAGRGTPHGSMMSVDSGGAAGTEGKSKSLVELRGGKDEAGTRLSASFAGRHRRRNTADSLRADSIINAHVITMQALESLTPNASFSRFHGRRGSHPKPKRASFSAKRHVTIPPLLPQHPDPGRPAHLPAHFIKTPYPFTSKKEFPKPKTRPRQSVHDDGSEKYDDKKGRHFLGIDASDEDYDLRSRLERNKDAQGVVQTRDSTKRKGADGAKETVVWLSLWRRNGEVSNHLEQISIPSSLTTTSPNRASHRKTRLIPSTSPNQHHGSGTAIDFDDMYFAHQLREAYKRLARPCFLRLLSARKLRYIQLGTIGVWSGSPPAADDAPASRLLAARDGLDTTPDAQSPFTEHNLMHLYRHPGVGKARYTWVHWARRLAVSNEVTNSPPHSHPHSYPRKHAHIIDASTHDPAPPTFPDSITTIQFIHSFSLFRILSVLALVLALSLLAPLLWIFLGDSVWGAWTASEGRGRADRVGSAMLVGGLVLGVQAVAFLGWVGGSWLWG
jgi:hypothetical protein